MHTCYFICKSGKENRRCGLVFPSKNKLNAHKTQANHLQRKRKSRSSSKVAPTEPKQLRLDDILSVAHNGKEAEADTNEEDQEEDICHLCKILLGLFNDVFVMLNIMIVFCIIRKHMTFICNPFSFHNEFIMTEMFLMCIFFLIIIYII